MFLKSRNVAVVRTSRTGPLAEHRPPGSAHIDPVLIAAQPQFGLVLSASFGSFSVAKVRLLRRQQLQNRSELISPTQSPGDREIWKQLL